MEKHRLRYYGDPILRQHCEPIEQITDKIKELAKEMIDFANNNNGIGLAAPQLGVPIRLFVLRDYIVQPDGKLMLSEPKFFINPKIIWKSEEILIDTEGCLSFANFTAGPIERPAKVIFEAIDINGNKFTDEREGINARVSFHENDHLNGVLYIDRLYPKDRRKIEPDLREIKNKYG